MRHFILLLLLPFCLNAQTTQLPRPFPQQQVTEALQQAWQTSQLSQAVAVTNTSSNMAVSGAYQFLKTYRPGHFIAPKLPPHSLSRTATDTLFVGLHPNDTVTVTGTWQNSGPIYVANNGVLIFKNADATILGNIYVLGFGKIIATNSTLYIPQQYFYQRDIITVNQASVLFKDCTLNFGGLTHNFLLVDSSTITVQNVHFTDWTTTGTYGSSVFSIDTCNVIGEIILDDSSTVTVKNTDTVLLWHHIPKNAGLTWTFPDGVNLTHYSLTPTSKGVTGLKYTVEADNCQLAWWALMPEDGSDVKISNSYLRAIGAWFTGKDSTTVTALADNSSYITSGNLFTDRTLILDTTTVTTWSLYPMDSTVTTIKSCIAGEIGSENAAKTSCLSTFVDGSGGYFWATDTSLQIAELCSFTSNVRSEGTGFVFVTYSSVADGLTSGISTSILFLIQTSVLQQPVAYDGSDVWVAQISTPASSFVNDVVPIPGSAYILRGPQSQWMTFDHYRLYYEPQGSLNWIALTGNMVSAVNQNNLASWNTNGLTAGNYNLMLTVFDNYNDSASAMTTINLLPAVLNGIQQTTYENIISVYPNPAENQLMVNSNQLPVKKIVINNILGQEVVEKTLQSSSVMEQLDISNLPTGVYFYTVTTNDSQTAAGKFVKK